MALASSCGGNGNGRASLDGGDGDGGGGDGGGDGDDALYACPVTAPTTCPDPMPRYSDVAPIFERRCAACHIGLPNGPWPLLTYQHIADWQDLVRSALVDCSMPPPDAGVPMTAEERVAILAWIRCGVPP